MPYVPFEGISEEEITEMSKQPEPKSWGKRAMDTVYNTMQGNKVTTDIADVSERYATGAVQGAQELGRSISAYQETDPLANFSYSSSVPMDETPEQQAARERKDKAESAFMGETVAPVGLTVSGILMPATTVVGITGYLAKEGYEKTGTIGGAAREATYGQLVDWYNQEDLGQQFHDRPVSTSVSGILGLGQAILPGFMALKGAKAIRGGKAGEMPKELTPQEQFFEGLKQQEPAATRPVYDEMAAGIREKVPISEEVLIPEEKSIVSELGKVEQKLQEEINQQIEPVSPSMGMSVKKTSFRPETETTETVKFSNPETEARWQEATKGIQTEGLLSKIKSSAESLWNKATRVYEDLPNVAEFSRLKNSLLYLEKQKNVAGDRTARLLQGIALKLDKPGLDLFTRKLILDDLAKSEGALPFGFTKETLLKDKIAVDKAVENNPKIKESIAKRKEMQEAVKTDYINAMKDIGFDVSDRLSREDYFRHQVLEYANTRSVTGTGERLKTPTNRGFLKGREGSAKDINANYLQAEYEVVAQMMYDTELAKVIKSIDDNYSIRGKLFDEFGNQWRDNIPEGYTTWQPREGSSFHVANTIPEKLATQVLSGVMEEVGVGAEQIRQVLAKGSPFKELVVKQEVADTLNKISQPPSSNPLSKISSHLVRPWKVWTLMSPTRAIKYNLRNITGDADALFAMNKSAFKQVPQAVRDLYQTIYGDRAMSPEMGEWFRRGGMESTLQMQELPDVNKLRMFEKFADKDVNYIKKAWVGYWDKVRNATQFREAIFRYATYLDYLKQMQENNGRPRNFGASLPEEVMALSDIRDRAFKLSNDVLGAYDNVSVLGKDIRNHIIPFWSFTETNFRRYAQFLQNQKENGSLATAISNKFVGNALIRSPYYAYATGSFVLKAGALWAALQTYNNLFFPEEEKELPEDEQARPHIIFGRDEAGKVKYFNRLGSFSDFLEWFGLDTPVKDVKDYLDGTRSMKEIIQDMAKSPVNKLVQGVSPIIKNPAEMLTGKRLFPDAFEPKTIKDNAQYVADSLGLGNEFKALSKTSAAQSLGIKPRPSKEYTIMEGISNVLMYKAEPNQSSYYEMQDMKRDFLKKEGKAGEGDYSSPKTEALRNYKIALRLNDADSAAYYLTEYQSLGGTKNGLKKSLAAMEPLAGINKKDQKKFKESLTAEQQFELEKAETYYKTVLLGKQKQGD